MKAKIEKYYKRQARGLTDLLFDKGFLADDIAREDMRKIENYIGWMFQSQVNMAVRASNLLKKIKERK